LETLWTVRTILENCENLLHSDLSSSILNIRSSKGFKNKLDMCLSSIKFERHVRVRDFRIITWKVKKTKIWGKILLKYFPLRKKLQ